MNDTAPSAAVPAAPDLRVSQPRRWNAAIDEVVWLPRLIDKARAYDAGTLGGYLFGQSPLDDELLRAAGADYADFLHVVRGAHDDRAVLDGLERYSAGAIERMRRFSRGPSLLFRSVVGTLDLDEGHLTGGWVAPAHRLLVPVLTIVAAGLRRLRPVPSSPPLHRS